MRIQTIHRNPMGDVLNECSAQGFRITTENGDVHDINTEGGMVTIQTRGHIFNLPELLRMLDIKKPAACRCVDCGGDQPKHDPHCAYMRDLHGDPTAAVGSAEARAERTKTCYQCDRPVTWLAPDSRCGDCTRLTPEEL